MNKGCKIPMKNLTKSINRYYKNIGKKRRKVLRKELLQEIGEFDWLRKHVLLTGY